MLRLPRVTQRMMPSLAEADARLRRPGVNGSDSRRRWKDRRRPSRQRRRITFSLGGDAPFTPAVLLALALSARLPLLASAQPRPPSNSKIVTVPAGERVLEGVRFSNPSSLDNLALIKFRDGLTGVVS